MTISFNSGYLEITDGSRKTTCPYPIKEIILDGDNVIFTGQDNQPRILLYSDVSGYATAQDLYDDIQTNSVSGAKVYRALLTQSGMDAPTAVVIENTLGEVPTFNYSNTGIYELNATGSIFLAGKTFYNGDKIILDPVDVTIYGVFSIKRTGNDSLNLYTVQSAGAGGGAAGVFALTDGVLNSIPIEILIYP